MNILVIGGAGFIGSHLVDRLLAEGHLVDVVDDLSGGSLANLASARSTASGALKFHHLDVRADELDELLARREPNVVIDLAVLPRSASDRDAGNIAVSGTLNVLDAARRAGTSKVVVALPGRHLYGAVPARELPVKDGRPWEPVTVRGVVARAVADLLTVYRAEHGLEFTALALASVYGPRQRPDHGVIAAFCDAVRVGQPAEFHGDGRQTRDFVYVDDAVDALVRSAERGSGLVVNVGTGVQTTIRDAWELVYGPGAPAPRHLPHRPDEPGRFALSGVRARIHLGWSPWTSLSEAIAGIRSAG